MMADPDAIQPSVSSVAADAETIVKSPFRLCHQNATLDMSNGNMNPSPLDTSIITRELLDAAVKANADPTRLVEIAKKLSRRHGFVNVNVLVDDRKCWIIPYSATISQSTGASLVGANVGHKAWVPRRPRPAGGHTQFDTRITFGREEPACFQWKDESRRFLASPKTVIEYLSATSLQDTTPYDPISCLRPGANNVAILVKLFLGLHLAERYGDDETVKNMVGVIDDSNRPVFMQRFYPSSVDDHVSPWGQYVRGAASGTHYIYAFDRLRHQDAHCLYLASVGWPFWPDVDFDQNLVPPQLAVQIAGINGNNVMFANDSLTQESFGDEIRLPTKASWRSAIDCFVKIELAHEECCYAREIAARITFYWPEHAPESHHRDIADIDAAALTTFINGDLVLPRPRVGRSLLPRDSTSEDLWRKCMKAVLSMDLQEGIIYDNLVGRTIAYAQGCVNQSFCISTDSIFCYRNGHRDKVPFSPLYTTYTQNGITRYSKYNNMSSTEQLWYVVGSRIFNFMPSSKSIELCYEAMSRARNSQNHHRLVDRPAHRLVSSSQVLDIMAVMPDACYLGIGNIALSNVDVNLFRSDSALCFDTFLSKPDSITENDFDTYGLMNHDNARILANFVRCLGVSTVEDRPTYYTCHKSDFFNSKIVWQPLQIIHDPVFVNLPEEATWATYDETKEERRCFKIQAPSLDNQSWAMLFSQCCGNAVNESSVPTAGLIRGKISMPASVAHRVRDPSTYRHPLLDRLGRYDRC